MSRALAEGRESECVGLSRAAKILGVCVRTVRREIDRGKLRAFRAGRLWKIQMSELRRYMEGEAVTV
jgi:excisionase family DNA binding protein